MSGKGGVGKSALTANLAAALVMQGQAVGVLDVDLNSAAAAREGRRRNLISSPEVDSCPNDTKI